MLLCLIGNSILLKDTDEYSEVVIKKDTVTVVRYDTVTQYKPEYISERVVDTVYVETKDSIFLPFEIKQRYFKEEGLYELWISGIRPSLDKINVFPKTEYRTVTNTVTNTLYKNAWRGYIGADFSIYGERTIPRLEFAVTSPKRLYLKANIGLVDNTPIYGIGAGIRIFEK